MSMMNGLFLIHPNSLRGLYNIHGHTHGDIGDSRHVCVLAECLKKGKPLSLDEIRGKIHAEG